MVYVILLLVIAGTLGIYYYLFKDLNLLKKHNIPHIKPLPLSVAELVKKAYDVHPEAKYTGMYELTQPLVLLRDPELIKSIALKHFEMFPDHRTFIREDQDPLFSNNLFSLQGDRWREVRAILSPAFTSSKMKGMFKLMSDCAVDFANFLTELPPEEKVMETKDIFTRYTSDVIATCAFGVSVDSMRDPKNLFYKLAMVGKNTQPKICSRKDREVFPRPCGKHHQDHQGIKQGIVRQDMLQLMMKSKGKKEDLTIQDMTSQAFSFFFGGFESISTLMCFAAHEIAVNKDIRERLQNEIDQVLEDTNGQASYNTVNNMVYLDAVVSEALRMYPIAVALDRLCIKDFKLPPTLPGTKPYIVRKGQGIWISVYALQHDPKYFKDPEKFCPEQFLGEQKKHSINTGAYLPFGLGPRMCIGNRFALMETKVLLFHLLARCDLLPCEKTSIPLELAKDGFNMKAKGGF